VGKLRAAAPLLLALAACGRAPAGLDASTPGPGPEVVAVEVQTLTSTTVPRIERRSARAEARRTVSLAFGVPGRVVRVAAEEGDRVRRGALLAAVETRALSAQVKQAEAQLARAQRELARLEPLRRSNAVPAQQVDELGSQVALAEAGLEAARAQLEQAQVVAPFTADVVRRAAEPGAWAMPGQPVLVLAELDPIRVVAQVPDHVRGDIAVGARAQVSARGLAAPRTGAVVRVSPVVDERTGLFRVELDVPNPDRRLAAGQPVEVAVQAGLLEDVVVLAPEWVVFRPEGPAVVVVESGRARAVPLGDDAVRVDGRFVIPAARLPAAPVVVRGQSLTRDGGPVRVVGGAR
jgi:RND family efflux transporter MFP subunit